MYSWYYRCFHAISTFLGHHSLSNSVVPSSLEFIITSHSLLEIQGTRVFANITCLCSFVFIYLFILCANICLIIQLSDDHLHNDHVNIFRSSFSEDQIVPWVDLPPGLLSPIANSLGIIDLLSVRGVCKDWRLAPSTASAEIEYVPTTEPWFILYGETEICTLYTPNVKKIYSINFPELKNSTCLASNQGWLLLFQEGSIFFFCPFSRARIDLPRFPHQEMSDHVAAFSCPPTSLECIVSVMN